MMVMSPLLVGEKEQLQQLVEMNNGHDGGGVLGAGKPVSFFCSFY
jgi:hypothetical protein